MTPEQEIIALDRFIDGFSVADDDQSDVEDLIAVVSEIRRLDEPEWPDADFPAEASSHVADVLRSRANQGAAPAPAHSLTSYTNGHPLHLPETHPAREPRVRLLRHRHFRDVAQTAAAILAVLLLAGMLAVVFQNQTGSHQGGLGGAATPTPSSITDPSLSALQAEAGFQLYAPTWLPDGWTLQSTDQPINIGGYSQVDLRYTDKGQTQGIAISESWPLHLDSLSLPPAVARNARPIDLGNGRSGYVFHDADLIRIWWQQGDVVIQFQNGLTGPQAPPDRLITEDEITRIAKSMMPVTPAQTQGTPTASGLPMTVNANGIAVTLENGRSGTEHDPRLLGETAIRARRAVGSFRSEPETSPVVDRQRSTSRYERSNV